LAVYHRYYFGIFLAFSLIVDILTNFKDGKFIMKKLIILIMIFTLSFSTWADIIPKDVHSGDRYIKITKVEKKGQLCRGDQKNYTLMRFEVCRIDRIEEDKIIDKSCQEVSSTSGRSLFELNRLKRTGQYLKTYANTSLIFGLFTLITLGEAGRAEGMRQAIREEIISDQTVKFFNDDDTEGLTFEEEDALRDNKLNEVSPSMDIYIGELKGALKEYDKKYPEVCSLEKENKDEGIPIEIDPNIYRHYAELEEAFENTSSAASER